MVLNLTTAWWLRLMKIVRLSRGCGSACSYSLHHYSRNTPRRFPSYLLFTLLLYFLFISYITGCTMQDFPSVSFLASLPFLSCCYRTATCKPPSLPTWYWGNLYTYMYLRQKKNCFECSETFFSTFFPGSAIIFLFAQTSDHSKHFKKFIFFFVVRVPISGFKVGDYNFLLSN